MNIPSKEHYVAVKPYLSGNSTPVHFRVITRQSWSNFENIFKHTQYWNQSKNTLYLLYTVTKMTYSHSIKADVKQKCVNADTMLQKSKKTDDRSIESFVECESHCQTNQ